MHELFIVSSLGLMLRSDKLGITSVICDLAVCPGCYGSMIHFFRATSWSLERLRLRWFSALKEYSPLYQEGSFHVLVGDGVKQSREGRGRFQRLPCNTDGGGRLPGCPHVWGFPAPAG